MAKLPDLPLKTQHECATLPEEIVVSRGELERERRYLLARLQQLNKLLGYPPLLTGKERRRQARND